MGLLKKIGNVVSYVVNPLKLVNDVIQKKRGKDDSSIIDQQNALHGSVWDQFKGWLGERYNDLTGQTAIKQEFENNKELAQYQTQMQEEMYNKYSSPEALMRQYQEAGLNPNLMYGGAGSGQGNVPSYESPKAPRFMSKLEQLGKGMSIIQGLMNLQNLMYNTVASREMAEQSAVKTLGLFEDLIGKRQKNMLQGDVTGYHPIFKLDPLFKNSSLDRNRYDYHYTVNATPYSGAMRSLLLNKAWDLQSKNMLETGHYYDFGGNVQKADLGSDWMPNYWWRNQVLKYDAKMRQFNYDWDNDYKTILKSAGVASPIIQTLLRLFGGSSKL